MKQESLPTRVLGVGQVGRRLLETLGADGLPGRGTVRTREKAARLAEAGLFCTAFDLDDPAETAALGALLVPGENLVVTLPPDAAGRRATALAEALRRVPPARLVLLSSTGVYAESGGGRVDEESPLASGPVARQRLELEEALEAAAAEAGFPCTVLRLPAIYSRSRGLHQSLRAGRILLWGGGRQQVSRIHVDDIVSAILLCLDSPPGWAGRYNLTDDHPSTLREVVEWLCERLDLPLPAEAPLGDAPRTLQTSRIVESGSFRERTGWKPRFPSYREGFEAILSQES